MSIMTWICTMIAVLAALFGIQTGGDQAPPDTADVPVVFFSYSNSGSSTYKIYSYELITDETTGEMSVNYDLYCELFLYTLPADAEFMQELAAIIDSHSLRKWDGFDKSASDVMDGSGFSLSIGFNDGSEIYARGSNRFPEGFYDAAQAIDGLFLDYLEKNGIDLEGGF